MTTASPGGLPPQATPASIDAGAARPLSTRLLEWADRWRAWLLAALVIVYAVSITGRWRVAPDSALSMSLGRSLAEGQGFTYHGKPHDWVEPGLPYVVAASFKLFGVENYPPLTFFTLACGVVSLALIYGIVKLYAGRPTAVLITLLLAVCETFYRYCFQIVTDMPFLVGLFAVLLGYERLVGSPPPTGPNGDDVAGTAASSTAPRPAAAWWAWCLLMAGTLVMCVFRPTIITFVGALFVATAWHVLRGPNRLRHALIGTVVVASVVAFRATDPRRKTVGESVHREATLRSLLTERRGFAMQRMFTKFIPEMVSELTPEAVLGVELGKGLDETFSVVVIGLGVALFTRRPLWGAWVAATVAQMAFWMPRERYFLPILPLLLLALWYAALWLERRLRPQVGAAAFAGVMLLVFVPNLLQIGVFVREQRWRGITATDRRDPTISYLVEMGKVIADHVTPADVVVADSPRELTYFSRRTVVEPPRARRVPPTERELELAQQELLAAPRLFVVLSDSEKRASDSKKREPDSEKHEYVRSLIDELGMQPGPAIATVVRPPDRGKTYPPLTLHQLVPKQTSGPGGPPPPSTRPAPAGAS